MLPFRVSAVIDAPHAAVLRAFRRADLWTRAARAAGGRGELIGPGTGLDRAHARGELRDGDRVVLWRTAGRYRVSLVVHFDDAGLPRLISTDVEILPQVATTGAGELVTLQIRMTPRPPFAAAFLRRRAVEFGQLVLGIATTMAREPLVVMAGSVIRDGAVLAARRTGVGGEAGGWELPGGKVQDGETEQRALARELDEELGIAVRIGRRLGRDVPLPDGMVLRTRTAEIIEGEPRPREHAELRWLRVDELDEVEWLTADREVLPALAEALRADIPARHRT